MQKKSHHVHRLPVHDEGQRQVHFPINARIETVIAMNRFTELTGFFDLCNNAGSDADVARDLLYHEIPDHFV
ncbi:hypothetical protein V7S43_002262 [Phytophthora oleae]|uniref:PiggyBac transposable element-derived protein domain-containing protein n=1 Tax=Phytophthora oleae TaxID=2107226 RepID=A0ABD3G314_9STRA